MHLLNAYFTPFALILTVFAIYFSALDKQTTYIAFGVLALTFVINWWVSKNEYKFFRWIQKIRVLTVIFNLLVTAVIFYLLGSYWAPTWLLFLIAPSASAMFMKRSHVFLIALSASLLMLGTYYFKSLYLDMQLGTVHWAMASIHAIFVILLSLFVNSMSQIILKVRDSGR
ncbi:MAG: hypothetical protein KKD35_04155 [Elusimicrobia bacterium]|nr:hypothetical protein [Elusimicrobiota bacterium]